MRMTVACVAVIVASAGQVRAGIIGPSESGYTQIYGLNLNDSANLHSSVPYSLDNANTIADGSFTRVAYHLELQLESGGPLNYVWVSMDAFTTDASLLGVPSFAGSNTSFQQNVANMNVFSNQAGIVTGNGLGTGNIEFWPYNYTTASSAGVPNASDFVYDAGDTSAGSASYGSMQIHNHADNANQTLFALNDFSDSGRYDLGIGNQNGGNPDWTFAGNAWQYSVKNLDVWVLQAETVPEPASFAIFGTICLIGCGRRRKS